MFCRAWDPIPKGSLWGLPGDAHHPASGPLLGELRGGQAQRAPRVPTRTGLRALAVGRHQGGSMGLTYPTLAGRSWPAYHMFRGFLLQAGLGFPQNPGGASHLRPAHFPWRLLARPGSILGLPGGAVGLGPKGFWVRASSGLPVSG